MSGSKQVASNTPEFRARTAQCERMSGAEAASRTSTACTPTGTSSSPLTMPLMSTVGVSKIWSCMCSIFSTTCNSPCTGRSTVDIICQGGRAAMSRNWGSNLFKTRLTEKSALPRSTSSTKLSNTSFGALTAPPMCNAFGPMSVWKASTWSPTTLAKRSHIALRSSALSAALLLCRSAAQSGVNWIQSMSTARSSTINGMCPRTAVNSERIWSQSTGKRVSAPMPWIKTACWVSNA
mmetsp:Transcript_53489/g.148726  ORF Transcript_53489/g.148726 Transcript_53489/m.148726 type:complete len:236 (-) Transcript_53489:974-1681(-)